MKAVILAAGEGRRLDPLTNLRPKPMLQLANRPILEYVVDAVAEAGLDEVVLVVGYKQERIQNHFEDGVDWGVDIEYAVQDKQLGSGHAILQAEAVVDGPFLVFNGDHIIEPAVVETMLADSLTDETLLAVTRTEQPSEFGVVEVSGEAVESITEKPPEFAVASDIINAGIYRFGTDIFDRIRAAERVGNLEITAALQTLVREGPVRAVRYDGLWVDVSFLWNLLEGNAAILEGRTDPVVTESIIHASSVIGNSVAVGVDTTVGPNTAVLAGTSIGDNVSLGSNVVVENAIIMADATVHDGAVLRDCIVGENATVGPNSTVVGGPADVVVEGIVYDDVRLGAVIGDNSTVGGAVTFAPGTVVGTGSSIEDACVLEGRIPPKAEVRRG